MAKKNIPPALPDGRLEFAPIEDEIFKGMQS
jgi:hypothetical protein